MQSIITWIDTSVELPDDSITVLVSLESGGEPTWIGYYDSAEDDWFNSDGMRFKSAVSHWAEMPHASTVSLITNAVAVVRKASIGDQNFIECLRGEDQTTTELRHAIVDLGDVLRDA